MIQPISMSTAQSVAPVSFSTKNALLQNETKAQNLNSTRELSPSVANSSVGRKLDFYA